MKNYYVNGSRFYVYPMKNRFVWAMAAITMLLGPSVYANDVGPPVGAHVPRFIARDTHGATVQWSDVAGDKGTVLVFFRSAK